MLNLASLFKRGRAEASADELIDAVQAFENDRQKLREEEQQLTRDRQRLLLEGDDAALDKIEERLSEIYRVCERHDLRIEALKSEAEAKAAVERFEADRRAFDEATAQRLALAEQIDAKLTELGTLFVALEKPAATLRSLPKRGGINGPMAELRLDGQAMGMVLLHHAPTLARSLGIEAGGSLRKRSFSEVEREFMNALRGVQPAAPVRPEPPTVSDTDLEVRDQQIASARRYA